MFKVLHNGTDGPVTVDAEGRQLGAGEWGVGNTTDDVAKAAAERRDVTFVDVPSSGDLNPDAAAARDRAKELNARAAELGDYEKPHLAAAAEGLGLPEDADKGLLVHALASAGVDVQPPELEPEPEQQAEAAPAEATKRRATARTDSVEA